MELTSVPSLTWISFSFMKFRIISRSAAFCGESDFRLFAIIKPPNWVNLSYISLEVYTKLGILPGPCVNHLNQQFNPATPNSVWASDFTYIKVNGSFHYLCVIIDLFSRKVVGWSLSNRHDVDLTIKAFEKAYFDRGEPDYVLFHSDQGWECEIFSVN